MTLEADLYSALEALVDGRVYPDVAPLNTPAPWIAYQQVGGQVVTFVERAMPDKRNARVQVSVWGKTRPQVASLSRQAEEILATSTTLLAEPLSAAVASYEPDTKLYGARQDFSVWF